MVIKKSQLQKIIKEEIESILLEENLQLEEGWDSIKKTIAKIGAGIALTAGIGAPQTAEAKPVEVVVRSTIRPEKSITFKAEDAGLSAEELKTALEQSLVDRFHSNEFKVVKIDGKDMVKKPANSESPKTSPVK